MNKQRIANHYWDTKKNKVESNCPLSNQKMETNWYGNELYINYLNTDIFKKKILNKWNLF